MITSRQNDQVKQWHKLKKKKDRQKTNSFLIEGSHLIEEAIKSDQEIIELIVSEKVEIQLSQTLKNYPYTLISQTLADDLADTKTTQGIFAVVKMPETSQSAQENILILDQVQDPGNLGTMIRSADAAGFSQVILGKGTVDAYNQKVLRSAQGSHFHIQLMNKDLNQYLPDLKKSGYTLYGTDLSADSLNYKAVSPSEKIAIIVGNEGNGVSQEVLDLVDQTLHIPIKGQAESLNVAIAASILMFHLSI